ncbi:hypothetical protein [Bacillus sp. AK031]
MAKSMMRNNQKRKRSVRRWPLELDDTKAEAAVQRRTDLEGSRMR